MISATCPEEKIFKELKRFNPSKRDTEGTVLVDLSVYFPFQDWKERTVEIAFIDPTEMEPDTKMSSIFPNDVVFNHRYPNKNYYTLAKKQGRKICKVGYPFTAPIDEINKKTLFVLRVKGLMKNGEDMYFIAPIQFSLTKKKNICALEILVKYDKDFGVSINTYKKEEKRIYTRRYAISNPPDSFEGYTMLEPAFVDKEKMFAMLGPSIEVYPQEEERLFA